MFFPFLFSFFLSHRFLLGASHAQCNHHSRIDRTRNKVFAHRELRDSERGRLVVCTKCTLMKVLPQVIRTWVEEYSIEKSIWREFLDFC